MTSPGSKGTNVNFFGRRGGPVRLALAIVTVGVLGLLSFVIFTLNGRLDNQQRANLASVDASQGIVDVNDRLTLQLQRLTGVTDTARSALDATAALHPLLVKLDDAIRPAADMLASSTDGAQVTNAQLTSIQGIMNQVQDAVIPLVSSAEAFGGQGAQLLEIVQGLVGDLAGSVEAAKTINQMLPLPG